MKTRKLLFLLSIVLLNGFLVNFLLIPAKAITPSFFYGWESGQTFPFDGSYPIVGSETAKVFSGSYSALVHPASTVYPYSAKVAYYYKTINDSLVDISFQCALNNSFVSGTDTVGLIHVSGPALFEIEVSAFYKAVFAGDFSGNYNNVSLGSLDTNWHNYELILQNTGGVVTTSLWYDGTHEFNVSNSVGASPFSEFDLGIWPALGSVYDFYFDNLAFGSALQASVSVNATNILLGDKINLSSFVSGGTPPYSFEWVFDDHIFNGFNTWVPNVNVTLAPDVGTHTFYIIVIDSVNSTVTSNELTVIVNYSLQCSIKAQSPIVYLGMNIIINSTVTGGRAPYSYNFTWYYSSDSVPLVAGTNVTDPNPTFLANGTGSYFFILKVKDYWNFTATSNTVSVNVIVGSPFIVSIFTNDPTTVYSNQTFSIFISRTGGAFPTSYSWMDNGSYIYLGWDFGNLTAPTFFNLAYNFTNQTLPVGTHNINVQALDSNGVIVITNTITFYVIPFPPSPVAPFLPFHLLLWIVGILMIIAGSLWGISCIRHKDYPPTLLALGFFCMGLILFFAGLYG